MTEDRTDLDYLLEGPSDAPVLVLSNSPGTALEVRDDQFLALRGRFGPPATTPEVTGRLPRPGPHFGVAPDDAHPANTEQPETLPRPILDHLEAR